MNRTRLVVLFFYFFSYFGDVRNPNFSDSDGVTTGFFFFKFQDLYSLYT